jgi:hypothetical protein
VPYHELADAAGGIGFAVGVLRCEAFVIVVMSVEYNCGVRVIQIAPEIDVVRIVSVPRPDQASHLFASLVGRETKAGSMAR